MLLHSNVDYDKPQVRAEEFNPVSLPGIREASLPCGPGDVSGGGPAE